MSDETIQETFNVCPTPRVLSVLGEIEFKVYECIAEFVDNSFDDFLAILRSGVPWPDEFKVSVTLPDRNTPIADASIVIEDNGRGMTSQALNAAVRAGWTTNDRFSNLGMYGIGFNIASARMGRRVRITTTRSGDEQWVGTEIDLDQLNMDYDAPVLKKAKTFTAQHGTRVEVSKLHPDRMKWVSRYAAKIRNKLGEIYSHLLSVHQFQIYVNGIEVRPKTPCAWDESRSITWGNGSNAEQIPAVIRIDKRLPPADACDACGTWQIQGAEYCEACGSSKLIRRERRIWGWLGIQRYVHKKEFGIDFLRNGRKILQGDKRLFTWHDPEGVLHSELEYPVELGQGGRIIGEIHLDHVAVNFQKNAFEWSSQGWLTAVRFLRGEGPLLPKRAKSLGYPVNDSPIGRLHRGYRRTDPGYRYLIPGNGKGPIHATTVDWSKKFYEGEEDYQSDEKWWDAVEQHEKHISKSRSAGKKGASSVRAALGISPSKTNGTATPQPSHTPNMPKPKVETHQERMERYRSKANSIPELSRDFCVSELGTAIEVEAFAVTAHDVRDENGHRTPVLLRQERGRKFLAFVDMMHPVFVSFGEEPLDYLLIEVAHFLRTRAGHSMQLSQVVALIKQRQLPDLKMDSIAISGEARELVNWLRERMSLAIQVSPERAWQVLSQGEKSSTETGLVLDRSNITLSEAIQSGDFLLYVPASCLPRLVEDWPEVFMDGAVFRNRYENIKDAVGRRISVSGVVSYMYDVALAAEDRLKSLEELKRCRLSMHLLRCDLAPESVEER